MTLAEETKAALRRLGVEPKKRFGQNFMIDAAALSSIAGALEISASETVLEIGPGLGFLTRELLRAGARVIGVEKDRNMARHLGTTFDSQPFRLVEKDILDLDLQKDLEVRAPIKVAGNIPYNITSPVLEWLIRERRRVSRAVLTVQWEVAERLLAGPGKKDWGPLSVFLQFYAEGSLVRKIPKRGFYPSPKVDSAAVKFVFPAAPRFDAADEKFFFEIVRRSFQKRRKTLLNSLARPDAPAFSKNALLEAFAALKIDPQRRPETLSIREWAALAGRLSPVPET